MDGVTFVIEPLSRTIAQGRRRDNARAIAALARAFLYSTQASGTEGSVRTTSEERIREYRARGWWSGTRITDLFDAALARAQLASPHCSTRPTAAPWSAVSHAG